MGQVSVNFIADGHGYISLEAFHWRSWNKVPVFIPNYDGSLISGILPPAPIKADLRARKSPIAKSIVQAKIAGNLQVLDWPRNGTNVHSELLR